MIKIDSEFIFMLKIHLIYNSPETIQLFCHVLIYILAYQYSLTVCMCAIPRILASFPRLVN